MPKPQTKNTIREVAARAGVSMMTVSRVMRNEPYVAEETRRAVEAAITTLKYEPLQSARNLASTVAKVIGLVVPHSAEDVPNRDGYEYLSALHLGAMNVCNARDYGLMLLQVQDTTTVETLVRRARGRQIGGYIICAPATEMPGLLTTLHDEGIVHTSISPLNPAASGSWVAADERAAAGELTHHLAAQGHQGIAFVGCGADIRACQERLQGYKDALRKLKYKIRKEWTVLTGISFEAGLEAGRILLSQDWIPSAVQCETDDLAVGVIAAAHELGMRMPADLSVVGFDNFGLAYKVWPALTTAHLPVEEMAAYAATQVIGALEGVVIDNQLMPCPIHYRQSVALHRDEAAGAVAPKGPASGTRKKTTKGTADSR